MKFLRLIAREYCAVLGKATREHDPNHLVFGDRLLPSLVVDEVIEEMLPSVDAIAIQPFYKTDFLRGLFAEEQNKRWIEKLGREAPDILRCSRHARLLANPHGQQHPRYQDHHRVVG